MVDSCSVQHCGRTRRREAERRPPDGDPQPVVRPPPKSSWHQFERDKRNHSSRPFADLAAEWAGLSPEEKAAFAPSAEPAPRPADVVSAAAPPAPSVVWPGCHDDTYPIGVENLQDVQRRAGSLASTWSGYIGKSTLQTAEDFEAPPRRLCGDWFGLGQCERRAQDAKKQSLQQHRNRLETWGKLLKAKRPVKYDEIWSPLGLLYTGPQEAAADGAADTPPGCMLLALYCESRPFMATMCYKQVLPPSLGDVITFDLSMETLTDFGGASRTAQTKRDVGKGQSPPSL